MGKKVFTTIFAIGTKLNPSFSKGMLSASKRLADVQKQTTALGRQTTAIKRFKELDSAVDQAGKEFDDATAELKRLRTESAKHPKLTAKMRSELIKAEKAVTRTTAAQVKKRAALRQTSRALDEAGVNVRNLTMEEKRLAAQTDKLARKQKRLAKIAGLDLGGKFRGAGSAARGLGQDFRRLGLLGLGVAGGIFAIAKSTAAAGDDAAKVAAQIGLSSEALQELRFAAERSGVSTSALDNSLRLMLRNMGEAQRGTGRQAEAFKELGLNATKLANMEPEKAFELIADGMSKIPNLAKRSSIGQQIFPRAAGKMTAVLGLGVAARDDLRQAARDTGNVLSSEVTKDAETFQDSMLGAKFSILGVKNTLGAQLLPVFTSVFDRFSSLVKDNRKEIKVWAVEFGDRFRESIPLVIKFGKDLGSLFGKLIDGARTVASFVGGFENLIGGLILLRMAPVIASVVSLGGAMLKTTGYMIAQTAASVKWVGALKTPAASAKGLTGIVGKLGGSLAGKLGLVGAAGAAGFALGTFINQLPKMLGFKESFSQQLAGWALGFTDLGKSAENAAKSVDGALATINKTGKRTQKELDALAQTYLDVITEAQETDAGGKAGLGISGALAQGIRDGTPKALAELETALKQAREFLPSSDAKRGPLSDLTASGRAIPETMARGMEQGSSALTGSLAANLPTPGAGAAAPRQAAGSPSVTIHAPITIQGNATPAAVQGIAMAGEQLTAKIEAAIREMFAEQARLSFG